MILAVAENGVIGNSTSRSGMAWRLPDETDHFYKTIDDHYVIVGRKTWQLIGKFLAGRRVVVLSREAHSEIPDVTVAHSLEEALRIVESQGETEVFIIGGAEIYLQALESNLVDRVVLTIVHGTPEGDAFFHWDFNPNMWNTTLVAEHPVKEKHKYSFQIKILERIHKE